IAIAGDVPRGAASQRVNWPLGLRPEKRSCSNASRVSASRSSSSAICSRGTHMAAVPERMATSRYQEASARSLFESIISAVPSLCTRYALGTFALEKVGLILAVEADLKPDAAVGLGNWRERG